MRVGGGQLQAQGGQRDHDQHRGGAQRYGARAAHDRAREPIPGAALGRSRGLFGAPLQARGRQRVDARAQRDEHRGEHDQRDRARGQRDERAADPHRVEETQREHQQRGERPGDRQRAEHDGAPGGLQRAADRRVRVQAARELLAVAGEDEQAVVDAQARGRRR